MTGGVSKVVEAAGRQRLERIDFGASFLGPEHSANLPHGEEALPELAEGFVVDWQLLAAVEAGIG